MAPIITLLCKVCKVKRALNKIAVAKVNAEIERLGLEPIRPWYSNVYHRCFECARQSCVESLCPCCIYKRRPFPLRFSPSWCVRLFIDGTTENKILKSVIGFVSGLLLALLFYLLMVHHMAVPELRARYVSMVLGLVLAVGLALSAAVRCVILSLLPQVFSGQGRAIGYTYLFMLVSSGPILNFTNNVQAMSDSSTCGQGLVYNGTKEVVQVMLSPVHDILESIRMVVRGLMDLANQLKLAFEAVKKAFLEIAAAIQNCVRWLRETLDQCNDTMGTPYKKCTEAFDQAIRSCRDALNIIDFLCEIPVGFSGFCIIARVTELLCLITDAIKRLFIEKIKSNVRMVVQNIEEMFYVNITIIQEFNYTMDQTKSYDEVREDIMSDIRARLSPLTTLTTYCDAMFGLVFIWLLIKSIHYRYRFMRKDHFDNMYISFMVRRIDERRQEMGKETILPLTRSQRRKYISTTSIRLAPAEKVKLVYNMMILISYVLYSSFFLFCDLGLWWLLNMIRRHFMVKIHSGIPHSVSMHVEGEGILADMYRELISTFDPVGRATLSMDTTHCLPHASDPDWDKYKAIGILFGVLMMLVLCESYGLRLRHVIAECYYPEREKERGLWLYNHILRTQGGLLKFLRRKIRDSVRNGGTLQEQMTWRAYIAFSFPCVVPLMRCLGYKRIHCLSCGVAGKPDDKTNFYHCENHGCKGVYCLSCYSDLNNMCTLCMNPIDYGDMSDFSEEIDSSEDDEIQLKRQEVRRMRKAERGRYSLSSNSDSDSDSDSSSNHSYQYRKRTSFSSVSDSDSESDSNIPELVQAADVFDSSSSSNDTVTTPSRRTNRNVMDSVRYDDETTSDDDVRTMSDDVTVTSDWSDSDYEFYETKSEPQSPVMQRDAKFENIPLN